MLLNTKKFSYELKNHGNKGPVELMIGVMFRSINDASAMRVVNLPSCLLSGRHVKTRSRTFHSIIFFYCQVVDMYKHVRRPFLFCYLPGTLQVEL